mmetsp:Transcript_3701/g.5362  ORF Transcript_3701/g.5362 Transcript_3701/m.5362 type:complete len:92 (+) Transcript_3701:3-278(+)
MTVTTPSITHMQIYEYTTSIDVVLLFVEVGGKALVMERNNDGETSLQVEETLLGGVELLTQTDYSNRTPLQLFIANDDGDWWGEIKDSGNN